MRIALILSVAMLVVPACKSHNKPDTMQEVKKEAPDVKPTLHVAEDDPRYVASTGNTSRQVHYYSVKMDTTYVVDENSGEVVTTFKSKEMPGVVVIDKPTYQPPPLNTKAPAKEGCAEGCAPAKAGCGCGAEVEVVEEETAEVEEVAGCGEAEDADEAGDVDEDDDDDKGDDGQ
ncbi:MAG: hypothetical protein ACHQ1G_00545 [Planctomycetota bacterium]